MKNKSFIKKLLVLLVVLITCIPQMWAWTINGRVYYDNTASNWTTSASQTIQYFPEKSDGSAGLVMTKLDHTKLYYWNGSWGDGAVSTMRFACVKSGSSWGWSGSSSWNRLYNNSNTVGMSGTWGIDVNGKSVLFRSNGAGSKTTAENLAGVDTYNNYSGLNFSQTVQKYTSTDNGSSYSAASINSGTVTITPYKLTAEGNVSNSSNTGTINTAGTTSVSKDAVYTGEVTVTASKNTGYDFVGWFTAASGGSAVSTNTSYTYNAPKSTKTIYARFKAQQYSITYRDQGDEAFSGSQTTPPTTHTYGIATTLRIPTKAGYNFGGWFTSSDCSTGAVGNTSSASLGATDYTTDITLYAKWTATITPSAKYTTSPNGASYTTGTTGGTVTINGSSSATNVVEGATYTISATPAAGYIVESVDVGSTNIYSNTSRTSGTYNNSSQTADAAATVTVKFARVKDITVYIYTGTENSVTPDLVSVVMNGCTQYVGATSLIPITVNNYSAGNPKFTLSGNWLIYTFTNVSQVSGITCARNGDNIFTGTITEDKYIMYDGTALTGQCVPYVASWTTAPANGTAGEDMTAVVNTSAVSGGSPSITWTSSDDDVAEVDEDGVITYVAAGTATITADVSWSATGDYCAGSQNLAQAITVSAAIVPTISAASFTNNPILTWEWVKISFTYANIPDGAYYRIKGGAGYYRDKNNLTNIPISGDGTEDFEAACDQVNMIDNQSWVVEIYNSSNVKIVERTVGNLRVTSQAAELSSITLSPNTTQNYAGSPIDITMSVTSKYVPNPVVIFYVADNSNSTTYEVVATTGAIGSRTNYTTTHTATFSASHAATYSVTAKVFAGKLVDDFESTITTWENVGGGSFSTIANPYQQAKNGSSHVKQITPNGEDWKTALTRTTSAWNNDYQYIHAKMYYQGGTDLRWKINDAPTELVQTIGATSTWQDVAFNNSGRATINFMFPFVKGQTNVFYVDDIILSTEASMTARATQSTAASVTVRDVYTITYKDQGDESFSGSHVDSPSAHPTTHTYGAATTLNLATKTGYTFGGWFDNSACTGVAVTSLGATAYSDDITLYAKWTENMTTVTVNVSPAGAGTLTLDASAFTPGNTTTAGVATSHTVVASANSGYTFLGWYRDGNAAGTNSANTYTLKGNGSSGTGTLIAVFAANASSSWYLIGGPFGNNWNTNNHNYPLNLKYRGMSNVYMRVVAFGGGSGSYYKPMNNTSPYGQSSGSDVSVVTGTQYTVSATSEEGTAFKTNGQGTVWCIVDATNSTKKFWVQEPVNYFPVTLSNGSGGNVLSSTEGTISLKTKNYGELATIYYALNESIKVAITAKSGYWIDDISINGSSVATDVNASSWDGWVIMPSTTATLTVTYNRIYSLSYNANGGSGAAPATTYYISGTNATAAAASTFTARAYYAFGGWNTAQYITGTNYAAGASVTMNANTTLYAKWTRTVTLNQEDATTPGTTSVTGTYNCATLPAITNPEKTGYSFGGWYTEVAGGGNIIINTSGALQADKYHWTDASGRFDRTTTKDGAPLYAKWTQTVTLNANLANHGSGDNTTATIVYKTTAKTSITHCTPATGYHLEGYYTAATDGVKVLNADGSFASSAVTDYITDGKWTKAGATTLYAHYEPNTYDVILDVNGATSGSNQTVTATFDAAMPTVCSDGTTPLAAPSKTGYTFGGYWTNNTGTGTQYYTNALASNHIWDVDANSTHIYSKWTANPYTVTLDVDEDNKGTIAGADESASVTFDAALTTIANRPTAANGYALDGYYTDHNGEGTKLINADGTWIAGVLGYTDEDAKWVFADDLTLYAYYKKAEITELVAAPGVIAPGETITITPTIEPTPTGTTKVCYELQYSNGTPLPSQPTFTPGVGNAVSFPVPSASATYIIQATLAKGSSCPAAPGDVLSTRTTTFQVAGEHTVTIRYQDSDGRTLQASASIEARPLTWTTAGDITPPTITGYKFDHWDAGDGVTIKNGESDPVTTSTTSSIQIQAVYDGTLTAVYSKKRMIYFNNTLGWSSVYVYFYKNDSYWENTDSKRGSGARTTSTWTDTPYSEGKHGQMLPVSEGSNIYYFDAEAAGVNASYDDVVFTKDNQHGYEFFYATKAVRRGDYKTSLPMFVPVEQTPEVHNKTDYYNKGYWMNYPENTGYVLHVYAGTGYGTSDQLQEIPFEFTEDKTLPMSVNVELNASRTYGFEIHRADGTKLGENEYTLVSGNSGDEGQTVRKLGTSERSIITTTVAGDYTFKLNYGKVSSEYYYLIGVHYPVVVGDYRILYTDDATWSKGAHAPDYAWYHDSRTIHKENGAKDIVSFYVKYDSDTKMKFQKINSITANTGAVGWTDSVGGTIDINSIKKDGVYNFYLSQANGVIRVDSIRPYTGKYYIRTDCAGATKWENFRTSDHEMTYSEYTETNHGYSHYYPHWVEATKNVKFCIANDYSPSITDTLVADYGTVIANIDAGGYLQNYGANIRFMWNQSTNKIWRAYIGGSGDITDRFLVLEGDAKLYDENGDPLTNATGNRDHITYNPGTPQEVTKYLDLDNQVILHDDENFVYERTIQVNTGARAKLTAKYNNNVQYFRGSEGDFGESTTVELLGGGAAGKHTMRIVYDFKTNRLVTAYVPSGTIEDNIAINADLMIVRNHQGAGQQLLFNGGSLSEVHTVYGVMRFNRWTLNNKETTGSHDPVGDPKSAYERALYWISFPFDVNLSDVFGFGTYGTHWIIMEYDGAARAKEGYWADSKGFWKYVTNRTNKVLEAGKGYVLALDLDLMKYNDATFWSNNIEQVELFFPSAAEVNDISETNVQTTVDSHECTIDRTGNNGSDINKNRTKADSHWNMIGIPSYANYGTTLKDGAGGSTITWNSNPYTNDLPFLYEWNMVDNTYTVQSGTTYPFKSMHAYMVQYHGNLYWSLASATPVSPIVARRTYAEKPQNVELRLELQQNEMKVDQTFVKLSNDENVSTKFAFDEDLCKEYNANKANIYTFIEGYIPAGGNTLPMTEQTMVVPVGVQIAANGDYTFAIPEGTEGIGITLIDNETGIRTSLSALDYTINLPAGTYNERFLLEISPVHQSPTAIELLNGENGENGVRKVLIDNILYIVKDGVMYDARGSRVQ